MTTTASWAPNQALVAQVEQYTFSAPTGVGNWYVATINGKSVTYVSVSGDTAATAATGLFNLLNRVTSVPPELTEIQFANPSTAVLTATAKVPGTPFANVPGTAAGLVLSTGNGLVSGIATAHTTPNASPSDVSDPQNWLRFTAPAAGVRALPQSGDAVVVGGTRVPMLWNLDQLAAVQFASYERRQDMTGSIGLPTTNSRGYAEWRACYFKFSGPQGSVPAGGLQLVLGTLGKGGTGPASESYNVGSQLTTLTVLGGGVVNFLGVHTLNSFTLLGGATLNVAMGVGDISTLNSSEVGNGTLNVGPGVTWTAAATLSMLGGSAVLSAAPTTLTASNATQVAVVADLLTWPTVTMQGGSLLTWLAGGIVTNLTMTTGSLLDKSQDARTLTITSHSLDGDTCVINDPLNSIVFTNAGTVKQSVTSGPYLFTGPRTVKIV